MMLRPPTRLLELDILDVEFQVDSVLLLYEEGCRRC